ncbi:unnamed protein product [Rodentolepis nana]|uniref:PDZ domain-containing protein n=1 Tax=Rodentolepis nana TaxID=102285 RepID=A0A0R3TQD3_RODNA|nr:unnamed protein product [Rodentolepis nana]
MPFPRYCCMRNDNSGDGFGFALVVTINETGHFIEDIKPGSLADRAGLRNGDLLVEVNGRNILALSHPEVVEFIRQQGDEVCLLVLDEEARTFYEDRSIIVSHTLPEVKNIYTWKQQSTHSDEIKDDSKVTFQEFLLQKSEVEDEEGKDKEQAKVIPTPKEIISQTPKEMTATIVPPENPVDVPVSRPSTTPQHTEGIVTKLDKKAEDKGKETLEVDSPSNVEDTQVKVEEFQNKLKIVENPVEAQEEEPPKSKEVQLNIKNEEKAAKIEKEVPMKLVAEVVQEAVEIAKMESVTQSQPVTKFPNFSPKVLLQSRKSSGSRCPPARKAYMTNLGTFTDRAKAFDAL